MNPMKNSKKYILATNLASACLLDREFFKGKLAVGKKGEKGKKGKRQEKRRKRGKKKRERGRKKRYKGRNMQIREEK